MPDPKEDLKKKIASLLKQVADLKTAGKDLKNDPTARQARKTLKRAQRRLRLLTPMTIEARLDRVGKLTDMLSKRLGELTQGQKKVQANPYVRSIKKKTKSLNKLKKRMERRQKKVAANAAPVTPAAPAAAKPAEGQA